MERERDRERNYREEPTVVRFGPGDPSSATPSASGLDPWQYIHPAIHPSIHPASQPASHQAIHYYLHIHTTPYPLQLCVGTPKVAHLVHGAGVRSLDRIHLRSLNTCLTPPLVYKGYAWFSRALTVHLCYYPCCYLPSSSFLSS